MRHISPGDALKMLEDNIFIRNAEVVTRRKHLDLLFEEYHFISLYKAQGDLFRIADSAAANLHYSDRGLLFKELQ